MRAEPFRESASAMASVEIPNAIPTSTADDAPYRAITRSTAAQSSGEIEELSGKGVPSAASEMPVLKICSRSECMRGS
jgi:hypothetical protein